MSFEQWQEKNPGKKFHQYYVETISAEIEAGKAHGTCGAKLKRNKVFGKAGKGVYKLLRAEGMERHSVCVDYGCGSLRIGVHILKYLDPGHFWGLDVTDRFFSQGIDQVGAEIIAQKRPHLRVISAESIREAANAKPDFIVSEAVATHVPEAELSEYFSNIMKMMGSNTKTLIKVRIAENKLQYKRYSWAYPKGTITSIIEQLGGRVEFLPAGISVCEDLGVTTQKSWLKISVR